MAEQSVVGVFESLAQSKRALAALQQRGVARKRLAIISRELESKQEVHGLVAGGDTDTTFSIKFALAGAGIGLLMAAAGVSFARYAGGFAGLNFFMIAGMVLLATIAGFVVGALVGAMSGRGVKEERIERFDNQLKAGRSLIVAHGNEAEMKQAETVLKECGSIETHYHTDVVAPADTTRGV